LQKKIVILATAFLVPLLILSLVMSGGAWYDPTATPPDDFQYERFGPQIDTVAIPVYGTQEAEYLAFKAKDIDLMDWQLLPSQHDEMNTIDPDYSEYGRPFFAEFGMNEVDLNNAREPTSDVYFRRAISHCLDKDDFIATELAGMGHKMETPLGYLEGQPWYNTEVTTYPYGLSDAAAILDAHGYTDTNADGWREYPNAAGTAGNGTNIDLIFYARADDPQRSALGTYFTEKLEVALKTASGAGIDVTLYIAPKSTCFDRVMGDLDYHMYTGGWSLGRDPDTLYFLYHSDFYWGPWSLNYVVNLNPDFDAACEDMLYASEIGDKDTPSTAVYHAWEMQEVFADTAVMIPVWNSAGYGGFLTGWEGIVNGVGSGPYDWFTFLNAHKTGTDTLRFGFMNDIEALNVIHSEWVWDWYILGEIYCSLINFNPYNVAEDFGWMAEGWEIGTWSMAGETCTKLTFYLRTDNYWQDLGPHPGGDRQYLGTQTFYDMPVTAYDVDFSINYVRVIDDAWNVGAVADVDHTEVVDDYTIEVYYGVYLPLWALHWCGGFPIIPKHIWEVVPNWDSDGSGVVDTREYDPIADRTVCGSGPYTFDYDAMIPHEYYELDAYKPSSKGYMNYQSVQARIQTSTATGTPQIYVINHKAAPQTVDVKVTLGTDTQTITGVSVAAADHGKPGLAAVTFSLLAGKPAGSYGPITAEIVGGHKYTEGNVALNTVKGDVNGDFGVSISDCVKFSTFYGFNPPPFGKAFLNGDITGDCNYNVLDAIQIQLNL
jgi:ABC-type oligopeptide transport system substrate-binding subunit